MFRLVMLRSEQIVPQYHSRIFGYHDNNLPRHLQTAVDCLTVIRFNHIDFIEKSNNNKSSETIYILTNCSITVSNPYIQMQYQQLPSRCR